MAGGELGETEINRELKRSDTTESSLAESPTVHDQITQQHNETSPADGQRSDMEKSAEPQDLEKSPSGSLQRSKSQRSSILGRIRSRKSENPIERTVHPETNLDEGIVGWDGQDDPDNPLNFPSARKYGLLMLMSAITLVSPLASTMFAPAVSFMGEDFHQTEELLLSFTVSVFLLGYTFGPFLLAPLSEIYGRRIVLTCANTCFTLWQIGCALAPDIGSLIVFRFLAGVGGSGCLTLGAGVIADLFPVERRGFATSIWSIGPLFGPVIGPICGGFIGQQIGWRWVFWILLIAAGVTTIGIELLNRETYSRVLIQWKTERLKRELNRTDLRSCYADDETLTPGQILAHGLVRPLKLFFKSPIVFLLATYMSLSYGLLFLLFTTITFVFQDQYGWDPQITGLSYLGIAVGFFSGAASIALTSDRTVVRLTKRNNGKFEPEMRMPAMIIYACCLPISFFWYGWSTDQNVHWIVPIIGLWPFSFGMMGIFLPIQTYCIDCYTVYAASAVAILTATRSLVGALLPLAGPPMYDTLGLGWGNSLLGFLALVFIPVPAIFYKYGKVIREKYPAKL